MNGGDDREEQGNELTKAQEEALCKAWDLLKEHFDAVLLTYDTEVPEGTDRAFACYYAGGISTCVGMAERAKFRMLRLPEDGR
jgi:hypothetical protein